MPVSIYYICSLTCCLLYVLFGYFSSNTLIVNNTDTDSSVCMKRMSKEICYLKLQIVYHS